MVLFYAVLFSLRCDTTGTTKKEATKVAIVNYRFLILPNSNPLYGWGYEIYSREKVIIKQETIPAVNGIVSFKTKEEAAQTAALVIEKLKRGRSPFISKRELDSLGVHTRFTNH